MCAGVVMRCLSRIFHVFCRFCEPEGVVWMRGGALPPSRSPRWGGALPPPAPPPERAPPPVCPLSCLGPPAPAAARQPNPPPAPLGGEDERPPPRCPPP